MLEEATLQSENQVKELKETIFELEDQVEQHRAVNCHANQAVLDMESMSLPVLAYRRTQIAFIKSASLALSPTHLQGKLRSSCLVPGVTSHSNPNSPNLTPTHPRALSAQAQNKVVNASNLSGGWLVSLAGLVLMFTSR